MHFERGKKGIIVRFLTHVTIHFSMIKKIIDVAVMVSDAGAAAKWYNEKLGFKISSSDGHWVTVSPEGSQTVIHLCEGKLEPGKVFMCAHCGHTDDADMNGAQNIRLLGLAGVYSLRLLPYEFSGRNICL